jgi:NAD(P)-dependent dehydrogenase (short-subunit alcohol dehydrogenase family)
VQLLARQSALVTGAGRGIGKAISRRLAGNGARVTALACAAPQLDELISEIRNSGGEAWKRQSSMRGMD